MKIQVLGQFKSHTTLVMATQSSKPSGQVRSPTTPMGEESVTPVSQPSRLGELSASMFTEPDRKQEVIQRAQVGSWELTVTRSLKIKLQRNNHPPRLLDLKSMPWRCGWKLKLARVCIPPPRKTLTVLILPSTLSTTPTLGVLACT